MKIYTLLLLLIACLFAGSVAHAQTITYRNKNTSLRDLLKVVQKQAGYGHIFKGEAAQRIKRVNIRVENATLVELLDEFFKDQPLTYTINGKIISIQPKEPLPTDLSTLSGRVTNELNEPVPGATITVIGTTRSIAVNDDGEFLFPDLSRTARLLITSIAHDSVVIQLQGQSVLHIQLSSKVSELAEVAVIVSTGYQNVVQERSVGSYAKVNNDLLNRRVSPNVLDRLDGITPGMIFNKNIIAGTNQSKITIRGRSTLFSNAEPLIVIDNFPYPGNPDNINPNDIESITVLKDANAAAIWGAFAGNGVIVMTTKKGRYKQAPRLTLNNNVTVGENPDAYYLPALGSKEYIEMERKLFEDGFYDFLISDPVPNVVSPVVEDLIRERNGEITNADLENRMRWYESQDSRRERQQYLFRNSISQQHALSTSGGGVNNNYFLSAGFDRSLDGFVGNKSQRITLNASNTYAWFKNRLELSTSVAYAESKLTYNYRNEDAVYPYLKFFDDSGNPIPMPVDIRQRYKDTIVPKYSDELKSWDYNHYQDIHASDNTARIIDYRANIGLKYKIAKGFTINLLYQFNKGRREEEKYMSEETYFTRNLFNKFSQLDGGEVIHNIPNGGIADRLHNEYKVHNVRAQVNYAHTWQDRKNNTHNIAALAGAEVRDINGQLKLNRLFNYYKGLNQGRYLDSTSFPVFYAPSSPPDAIPVPFDDRETFDRYISYYFSGNYTFDKRYTLSLSARKDESNLFGVRTNQKGVPLFSVGAGWEISEEKFFHFNWLPHLRLRVTHGYNGNINKSVTAYITALSLQTNSYREPSSTIINPANPDLRWEKIQMTNIGIDFALANRMVDGTIEYYFKRGSDLIGRTAIDPTTGFSEFTGNVAAMRGNGIDISITTRNLTRGLKWNTIILFNRSVDKVTDYTDTLPNISGYYNYLEFTPLQGKPLHAVYSLRWEGLDAQNGDPIGSLNGSPSKDYASITNSRNIDDLVYNGPAYPTFFGSLRNNFSWKQIGLSFNIVWKAGYFIRRNSINYFGMLYEKDKGHPDFNLRWQKPGDELNTNVPSFDPLAFVVRDNFYKFSEVLVERGDHIRLQDIELSYDISRQHFKKLPLQLIHFYIYANNIGILWKASKVDIDPDHVQNIPNPRTFSAGVKLEF